MERSAKHCPFCGTLLPPSPFNPTPSYTETGRLVLVLAVEQGAPAGTTSFELTTERKVIGRSEQADFRITLPSISRRHAAVWVEEGVARVEDLGSQHGTFVNYHKIAQPTNLRPGDRVSLGGDVHFHLVLEDDEEGATNRRKGDEEIPLPPVKPVSSDLPPASAATGHLQVISSYCSATFQVASEQELFEQALDHLKQLLPAERFFAMTGRAIETLQVLAHRGELDPPPSRGIMRRVLYSLSDRPFVSGDAQSETGIRERSSIVMSNVRSVMCVGLVGAGQCEGMIYVDTLGSDQPFSADDEHFLHVIAQVTVARLSAIRTRVELEAMQEELTHRSGGVSPLKPVDVS